MVEAVTAVTEVDKAVVATEEIAEAKVADIKVKEVATEVVTVVVAVTRHPWRCMEPNPLCTGLAFKRINFDTVWDVMQQRSANMVTLQTFMKGELFIN